MEARSSKTEIILMDYLRREGIRTQRQIKIGPYRVDFLIENLGLIVEVEGPYHESDRSKERDIRRQSYLESRGYTVLRFTVSEVRRDPEGVANFIKKYRTIQKQIKRGFI